MAVMNRYEVLGLKTDATLEEIRRAYKKLAAKTHPDVAGEVMKPLFLSVQDAYETLSNASRRAAYDREIGETRPAPPRPEPSAPKPAPRHEPAPGPSRQGAPSTPAPDKPPSGRDVKIRRLRIGATAAFFAGLGGYWLFQEMQLLHLVQSDGLRLFTFQGLPAIVYAVLWAFGTLVAAVADDVGTAMKTPLGCAAVSGAFAFITATGTTDIWFPALFTGLALTFFIAAAVRLRNV
jgi:hypothetical protein